MKVVFPSPDSPATWNALAHALCNNRTGRDAYHDSEGGASLCDNLVSLVGQIRNPDWRRAFRSRGSHCRDGSEERKQLKEHGAVDKSRAIGLRQVEKPFRSYGGDSRER